MYYLKNKGKLLQKRIHRYNYFKKLLRSYVELENRKSNGINGRQKTFSAK